MSCALLLRAVFLAVSALTSVAAPAGLVVDQQNYDPHAHVSLYRPTFDTSRYSQSFVPRQNTVAGAALYFYSIPLTTGPISLTVNLLDSPPGTGHVLASAHAESIDFLPSAMELFWPAVTVTPGRVYFLEPITSSNLLGTLIYPGTYYPDGLLYLDDQPAMFGGRLGWTLAFTEYAGSPDAPRIPAPNTFVLLTLAMFMHIVTLRRRQSPTTHPSTNGAD